MHFVHFATTPHAVVLELANFTRRDWEENVDRCGIIPHLQLVTMVGLTKI